MNIKKINFGAQNVSFTGHNKKLNDKGHDIHSFYYMYDPKKWACDVEIYNIEKDKNGNLSVGSLAKTLDLSKGHAELNVRRTPEITSKLGFAYRFKLSEIDENKQKVADGKVSYAFDNGTVVGIFDNSEKFNVVLNNRATINKNGPMQLIMPDGYYPGVVKDNAGQPYVDAALRAKALTSNRTHANKLGGNLHGIIERLDKIAGVEGVKRIVGTPLTEDNISSHLYWTENAYRVCPNLGTEEDFKTLQVELFKRGINWIADAALVNEGFGGIHMSEFLRKGQNSISKNMFRADEKVSLGIIPDSTEYTKIKLMNAPFVITSSGEFVSKNDNYDASKPTYVQFYDTRLASQKQIDSDKPMDMTTYENKNTDNIYDITRHDDAVYPFPIEVDPSQLKRNVKTYYEQKGNLDLGNVDTIKALLDFQNFNVTNKSAASGLEVWDGNVDIAKLNFYMSLNDDTRFSHLPTGIREEAIQDFKNGALAVREYAINSGKHWTKLAADTQLKYASELFGATPKSAQEYLDFINQAVKEGKLPAAENEINLDVLKSVLNGSYKSRRLNVADIRSEFNKEAYGNIYKYEDYILKQAMDVPFAVLPVSTNLLGVLTSPYIEKKPYLESELGVSRYDLYKADNPNLPAKYSSVYSKMDDVYQDELLPIMEQIFSDVDGLVNKNNGQVTPFGKFAIAELAPDLTKYLLLKAIAPNADVAVKDGNFDFSNVDKNSITIQSLGIPYSGKTMEQEASIVVNKIKNGLASMPPEEIDKLKNAVNTRLANRSIEGYRVAEMIIDRSEAGLGWRIDAAKDIASIDSVRKGVDSMAQAFDNVTDFWAKYNKFVLVENPHAYTTAEMTDLDGLFGAEAPEKYASAADAERKFLEETGITSIANYNYFFSLLPDLYAPLMLELPYGDQGGWQSRQENNKFLLAKMNEGWGNNPGFLFNSPDDGVKNAYNFVGNHDKSRMLHLLALDPDILLNNSVEEAMSARLKIAFNSVLTDDTEKAAVERAINEMAAGQFKGKPFDKTAFGTRPFDVAIQTVLEQVEYNGSSVANVKKVKNDVLQSILEPAFDRFLSIYKTLVTLPGSPTDFAGDRIGNSGHETIAKNYHQQNRNVIHWEWIDPNSEQYLPFVETFYNETNKIAGLRKNPELSALNNGDTITLNILERKRKNLVSQLEKYNSELSGSEIELSALITDCINVFSDNASTPNECAKSIAPILKTMRKINEPRIKALNNLKVALGDNADFDENYKKLKAQIDGDQAIIDVLQKYGDKSQQIQATMRYNDEGSCVLCFYNSAGASTPLTQRMPGKAGDVEQTSFKPNQIVAEDKLYLFSDENNARSGLKHGLEVGMEFYNAANIGKNDKYEKYVVAKDADGNYYLQKFLGEKKVKRDIGQVVEWSKESSPVTISDKDNNVLVLYKPKN